MLKKLALLLILLVPVFASQAMTFSFSSISSLVSSNGSCASGDFIAFGFNSPIAGTVNDGGDIDWAAFVLYDGNGTPIGIGHAVAYLGVSGNLVGVNIPLLSSAMARPFTLQVFDVSSPQSIDTAPGFPLLANVTVDPAAYGACDFLPDATAIVVSDDGSAPHFTDGRINGFDMASPFVVFGQDFQDGRGLVVYSPEGELLLIVPPSEFAAECTGETVLLARVNGVSLYRLDTCEYQMMAATLDGTKTYILIFNSPYPDTGYSSHEE